MSERPANPEELARDLAGVIDKLPVTYTEHGIAFFNDTKNILAGLSQGSNATDLHQSVQIMDEALRELEKLKGLYRETIVALGRYAAHSGISLPDMPSFPWVNLELQPSDLPTAAAEPASQEDELDQDRDMEPVASQVDPSLQSMPTATSQDKNNPNYVQLDIEGGYVEGSVRGGQAYIAFTSVQEGYRGQGKGAYLIAQFALEAIARGASTLTAGVSVTPAIVNFIKIFGVTNIKLTDTRNLDWSVTDGGQLDIEDMIGRVQTTGVDIEIDLTDPEIRRRLGL